MKVENIIGTNYQLAKGVVFKVLKAEESKNIFIKNKTALNGKKLIAKKTRSGTFIPMITIDGAMIIRLTRIEVNGKTIRRPGAISEALGVTDEATSYVLRETA